MGLRNDRGQATVEHLGIVAMVALVMVSAGAISAVAAPGLFNRVSEGFQHALCVVTGQACERVAREPCPVRRQTDRSSQGVAAGWLRLGHDRVLFIERRSDGSYLLSLVEGGRAGAGIGRAVGARGLGASADASLTLGWKGGRQYVVATPDEARALVRRLRDDPMPAVSTQLAGALDLAGLRDADPAVDSYVLSGDAAGEAMTKFGFKGILDVGAEASLGGEIGVKIAAHRKELTAYVKADAKITAFYDAFSGATVSRRRRGGAAPAPAPAGPAGKPDLTKRPAPADDPPPAHGKDTLELTAPSPTKLEGAVNGSVALKFGPGPRLLGVEVVVSASSAKKQREFRARLDPSDPAVGEAVARWRRDPTDADALRALGVVAADSAALDDRTFDLTDDKKVGGLVASTHAGELGLTLTDERSIGELIEQRSKPSGGLWETRLDCTPAA